MIRFLLGALLVAEFICMLGMARVNAVMERRLAEGEPMTFGERVVEMNRLAPRESHAALWPNRGGKR